MSVMIEPDLNFIKGLTESGAATVKKCYQCATCSVVCNVAPAGNPFPRKEMVWAQWGLKDKLAADPDVWLCHNCGDCSTNCPRGANPAEVLGALRKATIEKYAMIKPLASIANMGIIASMIIPAIIIIAILGAFGHLNPTVNYTELAGGKGMVFNDFFPIHVVDPLFTAAFFFGVASAIYGIKNFWADMSEQAGLGKLTGRNGLPSIPATLVQVIQHDLFDKCGTHKGRKLPHMIVVGSFVALAITTGWAVFYMYVLGMKPGEYSTLLNPLKWLGNLGALGLLAGIILLMKNRAATPDKTGSTGSSFDWSLLYLILLVGLTGTGAEVLRIAGVYAGAYIVYAIHLMMVLTLFIYTPYSKLGHLIYRTTAMVFARHTGKTLGYSTTPEPAAAPAATEAA